MECVHTATEGIASLTVLRCRKQYDREAAVYPKKNLLQLCHGRNPPHLGIAIHNNSDIKRHAGAHVE
ncbi:unnamed protein product [Chondrus crispus]|uniref:Uncharacterized protein n=1 Tax=Chondrus crispus TaxID=2769 RepID=R7QEC2_CHOCR|nr:unnamed protein product [Chondrus crispus]CDF36862.1 unnamed protein product [Chondrus crispus]|eukprot:XP_005716681.1 unnamed protein product [Chondrus crispus]